MPACRHRRGRYFSAAALERSVRPAPARTVAMSSKSFWLMKSEPDDCSIDDALSAPGQTHAVGANVCPLATLVTRVPSGDDWLFEIKFDGYRILSLVKDGKARLISRNGMDWTEQFAAGAFQQVLVVVTGFRARDHAAPTVTAWGRSWDGQEAARFSSAPLAQTLSLRKPPLALAWAGSPVNEPLLIA